VIHCLEAAIERRVSEVRDFMFVFDDVWIDR
jgi:hypothetical protein